MYQSKLKTLKKIFTSEYWLIASLCGAFFSFFALNRGGVVVFIDVCLVFLLINFLAGTCHLKSVPARFWILTGVCAYLLLVSTVFYPEVSHYRWMAYMLRMLVIVFTIYCLSLNVIQHWIKMLWAIVMSAAICWQSISYYLLNRPDGTFTNPHYLSSFTMLALPIMIFFLLTIKGWPKWLFALVALLDLDLMVKVPSRPAVLGFTAGAIFFLLFLTKGRRKWGGLALLSVVLTGLLISNYGNLYSRFEELILTLPNEERVTIWSDTWKLLKENSIKTWVFGNGIGVFRNVYPTLTSPLAAAKINFPHFHLLEILYDNGLIAVILVFSGMVSTIIIAVKAAKHAVNENIRILIKCLTVALIGWLIHTGLTFPFYSKYSQYSLAFILGILLSVVDYPAARMQNQNETRSNT